MGSMGLKEAQILDEIEYLQNKLNVAQWAYGLYLAQEGVKHGEEHTVKAVEEFISKDQGLVGEGCQEAE